MIYAVDIDGTLSEEDENPENWFRYADCVPIQETIDKINELHGEIGDTTHTIVLYTARFEEDRMVTQQWLSKHGVKYHRLIMGKFRADIYVDSNAKRPEEL